MKPFYLALGFIGLIIGAIGAVLPLLPSFPFLCLAAFGFAKGSDRLNNWFHQTKLYKNNVEPFLETKQMPMKTKIKIMVTVTIIMAISFVCMHNVRIGQIVLGIVWVFHILYFMFAIKTAPGE